LTANCTFDPDLAQHRDRGVAHDLVFLVGQGQRRRHRHRVAGMDAHRVYILDRADDDAVVRIVADNLHLVFLPAQHRFLDQHLVDRRGAQAVGHHLLEFDLVVGDAAAGAGQREGRPDNRRQAGDLQRRARLLHIVHDLAAWRFQADLVHRVAEKLAVLGLGDNVRLRADHLHAQPLQRAVFMQRHGSVQRRLPAHGGQQHVRTLGGNHLLQELRRDRLDIDRVGGIRVGHDGRRVGVHQHHAVTFLAQRLAGLRPGIIELASLPDNNRPRAHDHDG
jgi:hypothetical protein